MPIPKPKKNEDKQEFIGRCMSWMKDNDEFEGKQKFAVCISQFEKQNEDSVLNRLNFFLQEETTTADIEDNDLMGNKKKCKKKKMMKRNIEQIDEAVRFNTRQYRYAHGKEPRGNGNWAFIYKINGKEQTEFAKGTLEQAKKEIVARLKEKNLLDKIVEIEVGS